MNEQILTFLQQNQHNTFIYETLPDNDKVDFINFKCTAPYLNILFDAPYFDMLQEARNLKEYFVVHRDDYSHGWRSLTIHGVDSHITNIPEAHGLDSSVVTYQWTAISKHCPITVNYFRNIFPYSSYQRLRFMLLEPGGYILPHSDNSNNSLCAAINISLNNPIGCQMVTSKGVVPFQDTGSIFMFNNHHQHCVYNNSNIDRFHIIVHGEWQDPEWSELVLKSYNEALYGQNTL